MHKRLKKRWRNALRIAARINRHLKRGDTLLWDGDYIASPARFYIQKSMVDGVEYRELIFECERIANIVYFSTYYGNGQDDTIKQYSSYFRGIKVIPNVNFKKFIV